MTNRLTTQQLDEIARHAIPHLTSVLTAKGRPELADCFWRVTR